MSEDEILLAVLDRLDRLGIPYMLVGSYASNVHGQPRATHDADVVVEVDPDAADSFIGAFEDDFSFNPDSIRMHIYGRSMFNVISYRSPFKIDIIPRRDTPYHLEEWNRRMRVRAFGRELTVATAEDTIITKLKWFRQGGETSGRQLEDARGVYAVQEGSIDDAYLDRWATAEGVGDLLDRIRSGR